MTRPGRRIAESRGSQPRREADAGPQWTPLPPPRKNRTLLIIAGVLVLAWIAFLLYLALGT